MKRVKSILGEVWWFAKMAAFGFIISLFLKETIVACAHVPTGSMENTVMTDSRVIINRTAYWSEEPKRGDIVAFYAPDEPQKIYLKRVMGLPGETIEGYNGLVYIDGLPLFYDYTPQKLEQDFGPFEVPDGCYFMMGDNRNHSWDSRYWKNTYVKKDAILGKVGLEFYPELKILE